MSIHVEGHLNTFLVNGGVGTVATVASISVSDGSADNRDNNLAGLSDFYLDFQQLHKTVGDLIAKLRDNNLIQS